MIPREKQAVNCKKGMYGVKSDSAVMALLHKILGVGVNGLIPHTSASAMADEVLTTQGDFDVPVERSIAPQLLFHVSAVESGGGR